jgi:hypothetical protein
MHHLLAVGAPRWAPSLAPGVPAPPARHPSPRHPAIWADSPGVLSVLQKR